MANTNQNEEELIKRQIAILFSYINERDEMNKLNKGISFSSEMAVSALNIIRDYMNRLKARICCEDFGIDLMSKDMVKNDEQAKSEIQSQFLIIKTCDEIKEMLLSKNRKYGDSALNPQRIFSKANTIEQINVRLDDKLSRIKSAQTDEDEDVENDLLGYLVLKKVAMKIIQINNKGGSK